MLELRSLDGAPRRQDSRVVQSNLVGHRISPRDERVRVERRVGDEVLLNREGVEQQSLRTTHLVA